MPTHPGSVFPTRDDLARLLRLAMPVVVVQVGMMAMGLVDTIMVGHVSPAALAAVALGNIYFFACAVFGVGVLMVLDPVVAQAVGAGDHPAVARAFQRGLVLALLLSVPVSLAHLAARPVLTAVQQPAEIVPLASRYALLMIPGIFPFLAFTVFRQTLQALERLRPVVVTILLANLINAALNYMLIFGHFGAPPLGVTGSALATTLSRWIMGVGLLAAAWSSLRPLVVPWRADAIQPAALFRMLRLGLPIGGQFQLEMGAFGGVALLMGWLGTVAVAGHQVAINLASFTFMVPFGIGAAAAVVVGQAVGRGDQAGVRSAAAAALVCGVSFMCVTCLLFLLLPGPLARLYTADAGVLAMAGSLLPLAGVFQVFDGIQVVAIGILRGLGDTKSPFVVNILGFWLVGIPVSLVLGFRLGFGAVGLWTGLVVGLMVVALVLLYRLRRRLRETQDRVHVDGLHDPGVMRHADVRAE